MARSLPLFDHSGLFAGHGDRGVWGSRLRWRLPFWRHAAAITFHAPFFSLLAAGAVLRGVGMAVCYSKGLFCSAGAVDNPRRRGPSHLA